MKKLSSLLAIALTVVGLTSCGGDAAGPGGGGGGGGGGGSCAFTFCMSVSNQFSPRTATIAVGATATWSNETSQLHNVTFAAPSAAKPGDGTGNIGDFTTGTHTRVFDTPGTYTFDCTIHPGMSGTLTVQ